MVPAWQNLLRAGFLCREFLSFKSEQFETAYAIYADGVLVPKAGQLAAPVADERPVWDADSYPFPAPDFSGQVVTLAGC
ncbi:MAG: hypothetical protein A2004_04990 [Spirochaetes bacterium GWC1_61_12]|nr:MAG: hypothetical protein A2Y37_10715 [Spirochaetes bacterium GWB1_60_80]OHD29791.1 MAG: hypothetical protein A2004_04990 [Spirochaetes bacterium GWC1_61_12]OHD42867.1 MAG: hypothetical protein A2Y35_13800 [Spirochaetes bacterium GWE1_60_18]HAW85968.1 hypothetical protein [Spirochaetaceae bacterium]HBO40187.1 hypothetical protein [Spirochaetaceae bacterium]